MDATGIASMVVALVASACAYASQRAAARASIINTASTNRTAMEDDAYVRARKFDTDTITAQKQEILELKAEIVILEERIAVAHAESREARKEVREMRREKDRLRARIRELEGEQK